MSNVQIAGNLLIIDGHVYYESKSSNRRAYWECRRIRKGECQARAITTEILPGVEANVIVIKNPGLEGHSHSPDQEASEAEIIQKGVERRAREQPEEPPARILRTEPANASPRIFVQIFTILGMCTRARGNNANVAENSVAATPFVYAFLFGKETAQYATVLQSVVTAAQEYQIANCEPQQIMADFEKAGINASAEVFPNAHVSCCFFHLRQSVYWHVQDEGLQQEYSDPLDRTLRDSIHMLLALAFVPENDVSQVFDLWRY
ncbi:hypothetical protein QAD02_017154 [Eretmocerus hayati]|uniref:Uncharacterized protein n=1 Tax=Eretmocerus hayati TaxID=131215 RepID=A0ACC2PDH2_9HYME|nr:hypothetical protein QAD02_017154 [Eretmocerus hayati]